jgi:hypothetical protein
MNLFLKKTPPGFFPEAEFHFNLKGSAEKVNG